MLLLMMDDALKKIIWVGNSLKSLNSFPESVKDRIYVTTFETETVPELNP